MAATRTQHTLTARLNDKFNRGGAGLIRGWIPPFPLGARR